jgi:nitrile hydratase alpha subunit
MNQEQQGKKMGEIIAKCWADESFKQRLLADANAALKAEGVNVPAGVSIKVLENTDKVINFVLPAKPGGELSDDDLARVSGGTFRFCLLFTDTHVYLS